MKCTSWHLREDIKTRIPNRGGKQARARRTTKSTTWGQNNNEQKIKEQFTRDPHENIGLQASVVSNHSRVDG